MAKNALQTVNVGNFADDGSSVHVRSVEDSKAGKRVVLITFLNISAAAKRQKIHSLRMAL
jgi:hypothetical protein